jgi:hypothetical protein
MSQSADMDGLLGINFMRSCGAIVDTFGEVIEHFSQL